MHDGVDHRPSEYDDITSDKPQLSEKMSAITTMLEQSDRWACLELCSTGVSKPDIGRITSFVLHHGIFLFVGPVLLILGLIFELYLFEMLETSATVPWVSRRLDYTAETAVSSPSTLVDACSDVTQDHGALLS